MMKIEVIELEKLVKFLPSKQVGKFFSINKKRIGYVDVVNGKEITYKVFESKDVEIVNNFLKKINLSFYHVIWDAPSI